MVTSTEIPPPPSLEINEEMVATLNDRVTHSKGAEISGAWSPKRMNFEQWPQIVSA